MDKFNQQNKIIKILILTSIKSSVRKIMNRGNQSCFQEQNSWFDCIGDFQEKQKQKRQQKIKKYEPLFEINGKNTMSSFETQNSKSMDFVEASKDEEKKVVKRERKKQERDEQYFTENSSSNEIGSRTSEGKDDMDKEGRSNKEEKQHIYSKNYRQRKKEQSKLVEEQNVFLKKRVQQLEFKVRELQLEISRLKYVPEQKQLTIQQLNEQFMQKVTVIMVKNKQNPDEYRNKYEPCDKFYSQFMETYSKHGFGGSKKIDIMNYYFNQVIESILRDSEKYFAMICYYVKDGDSIQGFPQYELINNVFWDILQPDEDKLNRLRYFKINLHPMFTDLVDACKQFNAKYNKILKIMDKIHVFMKTSYPSNFDFARKRIIELQAWFQQYKYSKMTRNLQKQWIQLIKTQKSQDQRKNSTGTKKKKTNQKQF